MLIVIGAAVVEKIGRFVLHKRAERKMLRDIKWESRNYQQRREEEKIKGQVIKELENDSSDQIEVDSKRKQSVIENSYNKNPEEISHATEEAIKEKTAYFGKKNRTEAFLKNQIIKNISFILIIIVLLLSTFIFLKKGNLTDNNFFQYMNSKRTDDFVPVTEEPTQMEDDFVTSANKSIKDDKPDNYYRLLDSYPSLIEDNKDYKIAKNSKEAIILNKVLFEMDKKTSPTYTVNGKKYILNGCLNGFIIYVDSKDVKKIKNQEKEIKLAIESAYYCKKKKDIDDTKKVDEFVSSLVERTTGVKPNQVIRFILLQNEN
jgi:hypothetical protein